MSDRFGSYWLALQQDADTAYTEANMLLKSGVPHRLAHWADEHATGWHIDVSDRMGEVAWIVAQDVRRKSIAVMQNPYCADRALSIARNSGFPVQAHIRPEYEIGPDDAIRQIRSMMLTDLMRFDLQSGGMLTILGENIQNKTCLEWILAQEHDISSLSWMLPRYAQKQAYGVECPANLQWETYLPQRLERDKETILRTAALMPPGGQLLLAMDVVTQDEVDPVSDVQEMVHALQEHAIGHWKKYWEPKDAILLRSVDKAPIGTYAQKQPYNAIGLAEFRRTNVMDYKTLQRSYEIAPETGD